MKARRFVAHFCSLFFAIAFAMPTYVAAAVFEQRVCEDFMRGNVCGVFQRIDIGDTLARNCFFLDGQDRLVAKMTGAILQEDPNFPHSIAHVLKLIYKTSADEKVEVSMDLRTVDPKMRAMKPSNPPRLIFECNSSDKCIEIIPGGRVNQFRIGCDAELVWLATAISDYKRLYLQGM